MNSPENIPPQRDANGVNPRTHQPAPVEDAARQTPPWLEFFTSDPRIMFAVCGLGLWLLLNIALWIANNLTWPAYYLMRSLDRVTGAAVLPGAPFLIWTIWGGIFGGLMGNWLLAPAFGDRENRSMPLLVAFLAMSLVGLITWSFVR